MEPLPDREALLRALKAELAFFAARGYGRAYRDSRWRSTMLLRDGPLCLSSRPVAAPDPCRHCALLSLVPAGRRGELVPCHHIPLNAQGDTIASLYEGGSQEILDATYRAWLESSIRELESQ